MNSEKAHSIGNKFLSVASAEVIIYSVLALAGNQEEKACAAFILASTVIVSKIYKQARAEEEETAQTYQLLDRRIHTPC